MCITTLSLYDWHKVAQHPTKLIYRFKMKRLQMMFFIINLCGGLPLSWKVKNGRFRVSYWWMLYSVVHCLTVMALAVVFHSIPSLKNPSGTTSFLSTRNWEYGSSSTMVLINLPVLLNCHLLGKLFYYKIDFL